MADKIDYIVSYIDFSQQEIKDLYRDVTGEEFKSDVNDNYIDFYMLLVLILQNLPFINKLYITCKDVQKFPAGVDELIEKSGGRIVRVNESQFMPDNYITFSSGCIEMFLWKIPGLSEHFIYGNDDMFAMKEMKAEQFFKDGKPVMEYKYPELKFTSMYDLHNSNATNLIFDRRENNYSYNRVYYSTHTMKPLTRTICEECYNDYRKYIIDSLYHVRFYNGFNIDLYMIYGLKHDLVYVGHLPYRFQYYGNTLGNANNLLKQAESGEITDDVVCVNDDCNVSKEDKMKVAYLLRATMLALWHQ